MHPRQIYRTIFLLPLLFQFTLAQFGNIDVTFDDRLLRDSDRQLLNPLKEEIRLFFKTTTWDQDYSDLRIPLTIQIIFEGSSTKGSAQTFLCQALFTNGTDQRYFDKAVQFVYNSGTSLYYDPVLFDPLSSFLAFYGYLILAGEIDTYEPSGGNQAFELSRSIALRGSSSDYSRGWSDRSKLADDLSSNYGLRKARFAYYYAVDLFKAGEIENAVQQFHAMIAGLDEVYDRYPRNYYMLLFLKAHAEELTLVLQRLRQKEILQDLSELDPDNEDVYTRGLGTISP